MWRQVHVEREMTIVCTQRNRPAQLQSGAFLITSSVSLCSLFTQHVFHSHTAGLDGCHLCKPKRRHKREQMGRFSVTGTLLPVLTKGNQGNKVLCGMPSHVHTHVVKAN